MYLKIEEEFKKKSWLRLSQIAFFGLYYSMAILAILFYIGHFLEDSSLSTLPHELAYMIVYMIVYALVFSVGVYAFIIIRVHKEEEFSWKNIFDIDMNIKLYKLQIHRNDIGLLKEILANHYINTRPKQLEAIHHYQMMMPRTIVGGSSFLTVLAFSISVIALVLDDKVFYNAEKLSFIFLLLCLVSLVYLVFYLLNKRVFGLFGSAELYKRLEASISEIYMANEKTQKKK